MKRVLPVIIAILLILIIGGGYAATVLHEKYSYSNETMNMQEYFGITRPDQVAVIMQEERAEFDAKLIDGNCYFDYATVQANFNDRFYVDELEGLLIYVEPTRINTVHIGESGYVHDGRTEYTDYVPALYEGETLYLACDYVKKFTNFSYEYYSDPSRIQVYTDWSAKNIAHIAKDTQIRYRGGIKSEILKEVKAGDKIQLLEEYEDWAQVKTEDGIIGYVEIKKLENYGTEEPIPVTDYTEPEYIYNVRDKKINLAWHNVAGPAGNDTMYGLTANTHDINVISPTWFALSDNYGNISDFGSSSYVDAAHNMGMEVWPVISNFVMPDVDTYEVLSRTSVREYLIDGIMELVHQYGVEGINVDFEDLSVSCGQPFVEFIRELSVRCHQDGIVLSVDNYVPLGNTDYYGREEQGVFADYVIIMGYDEHYKGSEEAGSVASIGYVEQGILKTMEDVPASHIINGIPFYMRIWETTGTEVDSQAVGMEMAKNWVSDHGVSLQWDETTCQNYGEYMSGDTIHQIWMEDAESIRVKLNVMDANNLGGVASWCLGFETPDIWDVISEYLYK